MVCVSAISKCMCMYGVYVYICMMYVRVCIVCVCMVYACIVYVWCVCMHVYGARMYIRTCLCGMLISGVPGKNASKCVLFYGRLWT